MQLYGLSVFQVILQNKICFSCHACTIDQGVSSCTCILLCRMCMSNCGIIWYSFCGNWNITRKRGRMNYVMLINVHIQCKSKHKTFFFSAFIGKSLCRFIFIIVNCAEQIIMCIQSWHNIFYYSRYTRL
jgi:hypothetical protein